MHYSFGQALISNLYKLDILIFDIYLIDSLSVLLGIVLKLGK